MSVEAISWALKQPLSHSSTKFVLVAMANCADGNSFECYPSIAYLCESTAQNRKTVLENIKRLIDLGYIEDTGDRKGRTGQIKAYRINLKAVPKTDGKSPENGSERVPKTGHGTVSEPSVNHRTVGDDLFQGPEPPAQRSADATAPAAPAKVASRWKATNEDSDALQTACRETWAAYRIAYTAQYGVAPVRNAKVSTQVKAFVKRLGFDESPQVAAWFVTHPGSFYAQQLHGFGLLLADAEKLRTEWATGRVAVAAHCNPARRSIHDQRSATAAALTGYSAATGHLQTRDILEGDLRVID